MSDDFAGRAAAIGFRLRPAIGPASTALRNEGNAVQALYAERVVLYLPELAGDERRRHLHRLLFALEAVVASHPHLLDQADQGMASPLKDTDDWRRMEEHANA